MYTNEVRIGMRVIASSLLHTDLIKEKLHQGQFGKHGKTLVKNRAAGMVGCVREQCEDSEHYWIVEHVSDESKNGEIIVAIRPAIYSSAELEEMLQLPFDPLPFDNSLVKWVETE